MVPPSYLCKSMHCFKQIGALYSRRGFRARRKCGKFSALFAVRVCIHTAKVLVESRVDKTQVQKLSELAKIEIKDEMIEPLAKSITDILALVDQLAAVDTTGVIALANPCDATQRLRADTVTETNQRQAYQAIAPQCENGLYLVPKVIE